MSIQEEQIIHNVWEHIVNESSLAFYIVRNDAALTVLYGNSAFYDLLTMTKEDVLYKYGNSLTAMFDTKSFHPKAKQWEFIHEIEVNGHKRSLYTQVQRYQLDQYLICLSLDVTSYEQKRQKLEKFRHETTTLLTHTDLEAFRYQYEMNEVEIVWKKNYLKHFPNHMSNQECNALLLKEVFQSEETLTIFNSTVQSAIDKKDDIVKEVQLTGGEWLRFSFLHMTEDESTKSLLVLMEEITAQKTIYLEYLNETQFYHMLLTDKEAYAHINVTKDAFFATGGVWDLYNEFVHKLTYTQLYHRFINKVVHPDDRKSYIELMDCHNLTQAYQNGTSRLKYEFRRIIEQNKMMWMEIEILLFQEPMNDDLMGLMFLTNIDERKKSNFQLQYRSEIDQLTNVYNRTAAEQYIKKILKEDETHIHAFMILDLDNFKEINDHYGHQVGDDILIEFSSKLRSLFHENCIIGRFGGDEFFVFMKQINSSKDIDQPLLALYDTLCKTDGVEFSVGITLIEGCTSYETVFAQADQALYDIKYANKGTFGYYNHSAYTKEALISQSHDEVDATNVPGLVTKRITITDFDHYLGEFGEMAYLVDPDHYDLLLGNQSFYDRVGLTKEQCRGMKCYEILHHRDTPCPFCGKANWSRDKYFIWKDINQSLEQEFLIKNKLITWSDQEVLLALAIDISNDKSIVDSMDSNASESHILLSSIQHMQEHMEIEDAMSCILESICIFFKADFAGIWKKDEQSGEYKLPYTWQSPQTETKKELTKQDIKLHDQWLKVQRWDQPINIQTPQEMLSQSYDLYQIMQRYHVQNQRWICLQEQGNEYGCLMICNLSANFRNVSFMSSLSVFIINEMKKQDLMNAMLHANHYDQLTDVFNRNSYDSHYRKYDAEHVDSIGVLVANIDRLKEINKVNGIATGDQYIRRLAHMLKGNFQNGDIYRLNGDEFLVILVNVKKETLEAQVKNIKMKCNDEEFSVSIGFAWDDVEKDLDQMIASATYFMQVNKKHHYEELQKTNDLHQRKLLRDLMDGIKNNEYIIYLQPKVHMAKQRVVGAEALIRLAHKEFGILPPSEFVPALESNSLIRYIDLYVFEEVCKLLEQWQHPAFMISLNFSRVTLMEESMIDNMKQILDRYEFPRHLLEVEMTEGAIGENWAVLYEVAQELRQLGLRISLDDFGIRYSNLSILSELYFDTIKLDKSLIKSLVSNQRNRLIVKNIIHMCKELEIESIAEGVETKLQEDILKDLGCQLGQRYLYGKPISIEEFYQIFDMNKVS